MALLRITTGTASTPLSVTSGSIANINDDSAATTATIQGANPVYFWFSIDLGSSTRVVQADIVTWYETGAADSGFEIRYSDSALNSGNIGTAYGSSFSAVGSPGQTTSKTGDVTARYWGLYRNGNFVSNTIVVADFNLYTYIDDGASPMLFGGGVTIG